jgi:hypothetical protein
MKRLFTPTYPALIAMLESGAHPRRWRKGACEVLQLATFEYELVATALRQMAERSDSYMSGAAMTLLAALREPVTEQDRSADGVD